MQGQCYFCGITDPLETHHIVPRRFNGSDKPGNLVEVCANCHRKLERMYDNRFYNELGVSQGDFEDKHEGVENPKDSQTERVESLLALLDRNNGMEMWEIAEELEWDIDLVEHELGNLTNRGEVYQPEPNVYRST